MAKYDIILLTESRYENPILRNDYINNVILEDELLTKALLKKGLSVARWDWARKDVDWSEAKQLIFRSTWNYHHYWDDFSTWLNDTEKICAFINPIPTIRWNLDKRYLLELIEKDVNVVKTILIEKGSNLSLRTIYEKFDVKEVVLKPLISAGGRHTYRIGEKEITAHEKLFKEIIGVEAMMLQEFQNTIPKEGELSLMFFGGEYSHAVLKKAKSGDFRVQDNWGGTVYDHQASKEEIAFSQHAIRQIDPVPVYGRVDVFRDNKGKLALAEIELIEPELWFRRHLPAADMLASQIVNLL